MSIYYGDPYVLSNATGRFWSGVVLCLRNYEQVRCGETADVWSVGLDPGESARIQISVRPVGFSGRGDHIQLVPIAGAGSDHIGRVGGVYASAAPDIFEDSVPVAPTEADTGGLECGTAAVEGTILVARLCDGRESLLRVVAFEDGTVMTAGSERRPGRANLYRLVGVGEFRIDIRRQLEDAGENPAVVLTWVGLSGPVPEAWIAR